MSIDPAPEPSKPASPDQAISRQSFLKWGAFRMAQPLVDQFEKIESWLTPMRQRKFLRPPGAQVEPVFLSLCTRCDACTAACPHEAISVHYGAGFPHDGMPVLVNLRDNPCLLCEDTPCIQACPTQALVSTEKIEDIRIGVAVIDRLSCTAFRGSGCTTCYTVCPIKDQAIQLIEGLPFIQPEACTGCGLCEHACPEDEAAVAVFPA